jgi:hypothetical protein
MKAYGHIPHIPGSRMGPGDHHCHAGQAEIATLKKRDKHDEISVTVKLDGSCMAVAKIEGAIYPLSRAGYLASTSKYEQHQLFHQWVYQNQDRFMDELKDGERMVGEWMAQAHGTRYSLMHGPFVVFDIMVGPKRLPWKECWYRALRAALPSPHIIHEGDPLSLEDALEAIQTPRHGELDPVEGIVWRVERKGECDFLCKYVRPDKIDGKYLPEVSGQEAVWNWRPHAPESPSLP